MFAMADFASFVLSWVLKYFAMSDQSKVGIGLPEMQKNEEKSIWGFDSESGSPFYSKEIEIF